MQELEISCSRDFMFNTFQYPLMITTMSKAFTFVLIKFKYIYIYIYIYIYKIHPYLQLNQNSPI
jgi:hypothetical protein